MRTHDDQPITLPNGATWAKANSSGVTFYQRSHDVVGVQHKGFVVRHVREARDFRAIQDLSANGCERTGQRSRGKDMISHEGTKTRRDPEELSRIVVDCAYRAYVNIGPGLLESVYEADLEKLCWIRGLSVVGSSRSD